MLAGSGDLEANMTINCSETSTQLCEIWEKNAKWWNFVQVYNIVRNFFNSVLLSWILSCYWDVKFAIVSIKVTLPSYVEHFVPVGKLSDTVKQSKIWTTDIEC